METSRLVQAVDCVSVLWFIRVCARPGCDVQVEQIPPPMVPSVMTVVLALHCNIALCYLK